ncbi:MAG: hypothetical protein Q7R30_08615 [Acidobacteriota bacterium]|nr:hypothetical protein [Acidobacteriota bacterium]
MRIAVIVLVGVIAAGCAAQPASIAPMRDLVFLTRDGCVNTTTMKANLDDALRVLGQPFAYQVVDLETLPDGDVRRGYPTPTVLVSSRDLFGMAEPTPPFATPT